MRILILTICITISFNVKSQQLKYSVFDAAREGNIEALDLFFQLNPDTLNAQDWHGYSPLILAVYNNQALAVEFLLKHGAAVNAQDYSGNTAMMGAAFRGYSSYVEMLLKAGAQVDLQNYNAASALTFAATFGHLEIAQILVDAGANPILPDSRELTPLDYAEGQGLEKMVSLLRRSVGN